MLRQRIIFSLIYNNGFFCQSRNFRLQKVGDVNWLNNNYNFKKIAFSLDELVILNTSNDIKNFVLVLEKLVDSVFIPISAGGGIRTFEDAKLLFEYGADKIVINTILYTNPNLVKKLVEHFGSQSIVASIDYKDDKVFIENGTKEVDELENCLEYIQTLNIGEIYLNSIDKDGTGFGYDIETITEIKNKIKTPLIIAGGAGTKYHLQEGLKFADAVATANLFNFIGDALPQAREMILENGGNLAKWKI